MSKVVLIVLAGFGVLALGIVMGVFSWYGTGIDLQETTKAQYRSNQVSYDAFWKSVTETAQVPAAYKEDFKGILLAETTAKYGPEGSKATFQWFKERNLTLPPELYTKVQTTIEAGRKDFQRNQDTLLDKQQIAARHYKSPWGRFCRIFTDWTEDLAGDFKPPQDLDGDGRFTIWDYNIVTSKRTKAAFESGEDEPVNVFGTQKAPTAPSP